MLSLRYKANKLESMILLKLIYRLFQIIVILIPIAIIYSIIFPEKPLPETKNPQPYPTHKAIGYDYQNHRYIYEEDNLIRDNRGNWVPIDTNDKIPKEFPAAVNEEDLPGFSGSDIEPD